MSTSSDFKKISKLLKTLPAKLQKSVVNGSVRAAAAVVRDEVKERVAKDKENVKKAISIKKRRSKKQEVRYSVYVKAVKLKNGINGAKNTKQVAYYLEYGTKNMAKLPFIRVAAESVGQRPVTAARIYFKKNVDKRIKQIKVR